MNIRYFLRLVLILNIRYFSTLLSNSLLFTNDIMILFSGNLSGYIRFPDFSWILPDSHNIFKFLHIIYSLLLSCDIIILFSGKLSGLRIFRISHNEWLCDFMRIFIKYPDFFLFLSLLCSRSRTLKDLSLVFLKGALLKSSY